VGGNEPGYPPRDPSSREPFAREPYDGHFVDPPEAVVREPGTGSELYETRTVVRPGVPVFVQAYDPRTERIVWLITAVIDVLLAMRFIFMLLGASTQAAFASLLYALTFPLAAPFEGMFSTPSRGGSVFEPASVVAIVVYTLIGWVIVALIRIRHSRRRPPP
jgi:hypothetical protein